MNGVNLQGWPVRLDSASDFNQLGLELGVLRLMGVLDHLPHQTIVELDVILIISGFIRSSSARDERS